MTMLPMPKNGLYAITQTENQSIDAILTQTQAVLRGGAKIVQYRDKKPIDARLLAKALVQLCHQFEVPLIINDDVELALAVGADGVHLGESDGSIQQARVELGGNAIIGVSCYNNIERAVDAQRQGANYVAFGRFFASSTKPLAAPAQLETLTRAKKMMTIPVVAIGGILPENGRDLIHAGADILAVIGGLMTKEPELSARNYDDLFALKLH
jgi:thiamine-phosphate pyrophosphorylase